jgi:hypothetical protein
MNILFLFTSCSTYGTIYSYSLHTNICMCMLMDRKWIRVHTLDNSVHSMINRTLLSVYYILHHNRTTSFNTVKYFNITNVMSHF